MWVFYDIRNQRCVTRRVVTCVSQHTAWLTFQWVHVRSINISLQYMAPKNDKVFNPRTKRWVSRTGRIGKKLGKDVKLINMPSEVVSHIARTGGANVALRLAHTSKFTRNASPAPQQIVEIRDALLRKLRQAPRAFARLMAEQGVRMPNHFKKPPSTQQHGRLSKTNFIKNAPGAVSYFKVGRMKFKIELQKDDTFGAFQITLFCVERFAIRGWKSVQLSWVPIARWKQNMCKTRGRNFVHKFWGKGSEMNFMPVSLFNANWEQLFNPVERAGIGEALEIFQAELVPPLRWC